jgi:chromosome segregation ATPase
MANDFEDAAKLLSKTVTDLQQKKKTLEIDVVSLDNEVKEKRRKLYHLGGNIGQLEQQRQALDEDIKAKNASWGRVRVQEEEDLKNKKNIAEIEILKLKKEIKGEREALEDDKKRLLDEKQALEIYEMDLRNQFKDIKIKEKTISDQLTKVEEIRRNLNFKQSGNETLRRKLLEERQQIETSKQEIEESKNSTDKDLQKSREEVKKADGVLDELNSKAIQLQNYQKNLDIRNETLNKKAFVLEGKERDLRRRELKLADREATFETHSRL